LVFNNEDEDDKFARSKKDHSPSYTTTMDLLRSVSKWEIVVVEPDYLPDLEVFVFNRVYTP
jgi:hypothetical protein